MQIQETVLQGPMQHGVRVANGNPVLPEGTPMQRLEYHEQPPKKSVKDPVGKKEKVNVRRAIYDLAKASNDTHKGIQMEGSELADELEKKGYTRASVFNALTTMSGKQLAKSKKHGIGPYYYQFIEGCEVPDDKPMRVSELAVKAKPAAKLPVASGSAEKPPAATVISKALGNMKDGLKKIGVGQYGFAEHDLDLIIHHLRGLERNLPEITMMAKPLRDHDQALANEYSMLHRDLNAFIGYLLKQKDVLHNMSKMAKMIRNLPD